MNEGVRWPPLRWPGVRWPPLAIEGVAIETPFTFCIKMYADEDWTLVQ